MSSLWSPPPLPPTKLGRYRTLSPLAGVRVSPLQLGAMSIGDKWQDFGMGSMDKTTSFKLLDAYFDAGGNFIDTANNYQDETSEAFIGEWAEKRGIRDQLVIATKYTTNYKRGQESNISRMVNYSGNNTKSLHVSVEASLKKLRTTYIDLLYVHWWDYATSVEEVMNSLHVLVQQGKVLYLGISDTPAWVVSKANQYAKDHGKTPFSVYQGNWSVLDRSFERDIIPMARSEGLALAPWGVLGGGKIRTNAEEARRKESGEKGRMIFSANWERTPEQKKVCDVLEEIGKEVGTESITSIAIAYHLQKLPYVFPIIGGRKVEQLNENITALDISLTAEQIKRIEEATNFDLGFPHSMIGVGTHDNFLSQSAGHTDRVPLQQAITPTKQK
ncbi:NADP-dependent oxidoreductase domain-containing protein [Lactarius akahatsu]|uniref:NADP-dependent oxidoreductase domain-containing protein n=1 Tax=Lactarius akahatsu TaxID=416441 RepID=A0AAD4QCK3_9AGAM|nr:NADP-dependent oxidoreductase domain-containing protein [Lactarius akahatsu]